MTPYLYTAATDNLNLLEEDLRRFNNSLLSKLMRIPQDSKIARIKEVRSHYDMNLKDAKFVVDNVNDRIGCINSGDASETQLLREEARNLRWELSNAKFERDRLQTLIDQNDQKENDLQTSHEAFLAVVVDHMKVLDLVEEVVRGSNKRTALLMIEHLREVHGV